MHRLSVLAFLFAFGLTVAIVPPAPARAQTSSSGLTAVLDNTTAIPIEDMAKYNCHDRDKPLIRCFSSREALQADEAGAATKGLAPASHLTFCVAVFQDANYGANQLDVWYNMPNLTVYPGWNDAISSFKSAYGRQPVFWRDINYGGWGTWWQPGAWVSYVGAIYNDTFSSISNC